MPVVYTWQGYVNHDTSWTANANWSPSTGYPNGSADTADFPSLSTGSIVCPASALDKLILERGNGATVVVGNSSGLTLNHLYQHNGTVSLSSGHNLYVNDQSTLDAGVITGTSGAGALEIINGCNFTVGRYDSASQVDLEADTYVGTYGDMSTTSSGTLNFVGANVYTSLDWFLGVGNPNTANAADAVVNLQVDTNNFNQPTIIQPTTGSGPTAYVSNYGTLNVGDNWSGGGGLSSSRKTETLTMPLLNRSIGIVNVFHYDNLDVTANGGYAYSMSNAGLMNLGLPHSGSTSVGQSGVICHGANSTITTGGELDVFGDSTDWTDRDGTGALQLTVSGTVRLTQIGSTYVHTELSLEVGNIEFTSGSHLAVAATYGGSGDDIDVWGGCNVNMDSGATVDVTAFGTWVASSWDIVKPDLGFTTLGTVTGSNPGLTTNDSDPAHTWDDGFSTTGELFVETY